MAEPNNQQRRTKIQNGITRIHNWLQHIYQTRNYQNLKNQIDFMKEDQIDMSIRLFKLMNGEEADISKLRHNFLQNIFTNNLCRGYGNDSTQEEDLINKYLDELNRDNEKYTLSMRTAGNYTSTDKSDKKLAYKMYFIYNQLRDKEILRATYKGVMDAVNRCNTAIFNGRIKNVLGNNRNIGRGNRGKGNGNGSRAVNNPMRNANVINQNNIQERLRHLLMGNGSRAVNRNGMVEVEINDNNNDIPNDNRIGANVRFGNLAPNVRQQLVDEL